MNRDQQPVYMIGVASKLCGVHPQTLRQYERLGLVIPSRAGARNRLYSERDINRVKRIQRLTQHMGVNLAGVEIILRLLDELDEERRDVERQLQEYVRESERFLREMMSNSTVPAKRGEPIFPVPNIRLSRRTEF